MHKNEKIEPNLTNINSPLKIEANQIRSMLETLASESSANTEFKKALPDTIEGTDENKIAIWTAELLGINREQIATKKDSFSKKVTIGGNNQSIEYQIIRVYVRSSENGISQLAFIHEPQWVRQLEKKDNFDEDDYIQNQAPSSNLESVKKEMSDRGIIDGDKDFNTEIENFIKNLDSQPFLFGTIDEIRKFLIKNIGDLSSLISLRRNSTSGENLGQNSGVSLIIDFSGETKGKSKKLFSISAENSNSALNPDGDQAKYKLDLSRLRANLLRKALEIKEKTILVGTFQEIKDKLLAMEVIQSKYTNMEHIFIEENNHVLEIGYMGGFEQDKREVEFSFEGNQSDQYEVDWSAIIK